MAAQYESFKISGADQLLKRIKHLEPKRRVAALRKAARESMQPVLQYQKKTH